MVGENMKKGFTLIELMAVILILGIIALIAVPTIGNIVNDATTDAGKESVNNYIRAVEDNIALKQEVRNLRTKLDVLSDNNGEGNSNADVLRRLSNLEKYIYSKD